MNSTWISGVSPKSHDKCLYERQKRRHAHRGEKGQVKMKAEMGVMQPQLKNPCLEPSEAGRGKEVFPPEPLEGVQPSTNTLILDSSLQDSERINVPCFKSPSL